MVTGIMLILGSYGLAILGVHWSFYHWHRSTGRKNIILRVRDNGTQIEWVVRSMLFYAWLRGKDVSIYILDEGSMDDTRDIAERLIRYEMSGIYPYPQEMTLEDFQNKCQHESCILIDLNREEVLASAVLS